MTMKLGDAICLHVVLHHIRVKQDHVKGMEPSAVGVKEGHDVNGSDLCVEGVGVFEVVVPNLVNNIAVKLGHALFGCLITGVVIESGFVSSLHTHTNDCCGVVLSKSGRQAMHTKLAPWSVLYLTALVRMAVRE